MSFRFRLFWNGIAGISCDMQGYIYERTLGKALSNMDIGGHFAAPFDPFAVWGRV